MKTLLQFLFSCFMLQLSFGQVGIGTTTPTSKLTLESVGGITTILDDGFEDNT